VSRHPRRALRRRLVTAALPLTLLLAGCGGGSAPASSPGTAAGGTSPEPAPAQAEASAEAAAYPAAATDAKTGALAVALRASDLPTGWTVQANPVPNGSVAGNPSLAGICGGTFTSEAHRTAKHPVTGLDPQGKAAVVSEAISYDTPGSALTALAELGDAFATCTTEGRTIVQAPRVEGLAPASVVVEYELAGGTRQEVIAQAKGSVFSVLIADDDSAGAMAARSIAARLAALPAAAVGG
jgi:hypothetical protein